MRSIRATLTLWYTVALAATVLAFGVTLSMLERQANVRALDRRLSATAGRVATVLAEEYAARGDAMLESAPDRASAVLRLDVQGRLDVIPGWLMVVDSAGRRVYGSAEVRLAPQTADPVRERLVRLDRDADAFSVSLEGARYRLAARRLRNTGPVVALAVAEPTRDLDLAPRRLLTTMFLIAPLILLFAFGTGVVLSARALRPVKGMIEELEAITDGRSLHRRLPAASHDADELGRLAVTINGLLARLETSFGAMRRFVADASHELKTPLTVMRAGVERALTDPQTVPEAMVPLEETLQEIQRTTELMDALLTLARVDEGRMELHRESVDLAQVLVEAHETAQILGEDSGVEVTLELPPESLVIEGDRARIRQLVLNLVTNAVKYTPAGGKVWLSLSGGPHAATVAVRDTGIGIAPGDVGRVFDRFWRVDAARSRTGDRPGFGLGLAIAKWIAEAHGGSIGVTSRPGRGSTFSVTLPRVAAVAPAVIES